MNTRKLLISIILLSLVGGATAGATQVLQTWKGKEVRIFVNNEEIAEGILIEGRTFVPVRPLSDTLQASIQVDKEDIHIYKPNVHLFLFSGDRTAMKPFGNVYQGRYEFFVFAQVDNLKTQVHSIRTSVIDPRGQTVEAQIFRFTNESREEFWYTTAPIKLDFKLIGEYKVRFSMKSAEESEYELLSEKSIVSMKKDN
jgi:hypothetical protein